MGTVLTIVVLIAAILLIVVVLLQPGKGDLSASFGGIGGQMGSMFGMQKTANILQKITIWLAAIILGLALIINLFFIGDEQTQQGFQSIMNRNQDEVMKSVTPDDVQPLDKSQMQEQGGAVPTEGTPEETAPEENPGNE